MPFVENNFLPPQDLRNQFFHLRILSPHFASQDFEAVASSASAIRNVFGPSNDWPAPDMTYAHNLADLERHEAEFHARKAFAYAVLGTSGKSYLGCVYINPIKSKLDDDQRKKLFQAQVFFWLSSLHNEVTANQLLSELKSWLQGNWPFQAVAFPGREITWHKWEQLSYSASENKKP
jgi:hypothetical protein